MRCVVFITKWVIMVAGLMVGVVVVVACTLLVLRVGTLWWLQGAVVVGGVARTLLDVIERNVRCCFIKAVVIQVSWSIVTLTPLQPGEDTHGPVFWRIRLQVENCSMA